MFSLHFCCVFCLAYFLFNKIATMLVFGKNRPVGSDGEDGYRCDYDEGDDDDAV